ncbi:hypothetical protein FB550_1027 [Neobacillus bataviensis]|uniref:Uncharacterized protein n=1 Tax=Neobacillus bataviensis TaxID=220685 RepID=A0A561DRL1_9BACI|nr:hypothetical protein [Neobacillus bataviensis]TWE05992.1 hypothetical protein FB550_1027 [Neobacillus bataviensis]
MPKTKRNLRTGKEIRELFENQGIKYVMISNKIIELYKKGFYEYEVEEINDEGEIVNVLNRVKFDSRNLTLYVGMKFLDKMEFFCYIDEIANFLNMSVKRIKDRIQELQLIKLPMNNQLNKETMQNELLESLRMAQLVRQRGERGFERNRKVKTIRWFTPFDCDLKKVRNKETQKDELKAEKFFMVTIYDLDLFINGILDEHEFALYLYLIQCFDSNDKDKKGIAQTTSKISENLNVINPSVTQRRLDKLVNLRVKDKYCTDENKDFPLIHTRKPENYNHKLTTRQEPSLYYYPIYNDLTLQKIQEVKPDSARTIHENKTDSDSDELDTELLVDTEFHNMDTKVYKTDADFLF